MSQIILDLLQFDYQTDYSKCALEPDKNLSTSLGTVSRGENVSHFTHLPGAEPETFQNAMVKLCVIIFRPENAGNFLE